MELTATIPQSMNIKRKDSSNDWIGKHLFRKLLERYYPASFINRPKILSLDSSIDHTKPPETGWVWAPQQIGKTRISISEPPKCSECLLGRPIRGVGFYVTIVEAP